MLKQLYELTKTLFGLTQDTQRNKVQIEELQRELKTLSETVRELAFEIRRVREDDAHEREKMAFAARKWSVALRAQAAFRANQRS